MTDSVTEDLFDTLFFARLFREDPGPVMPLMSFSPSSNQFNQVFWSASFVWIAILWLHVLAS